MPNATNLGEFEREIDEAVHEASARFVDVHREVALYVYDQVLGRSPVRTGRYRASHTLAVGAPDGTVHPGPEEGHGGARAGVVTAPNLADARQRLAGLTPFEVVWISNRLVYADLIERGTSDQAPHGVYAVAAASAEARFANVE